jgi:cytochrome c oxidase subunit II
VNPRAINQTAFANPGLRAMGDNRYEAYIIAQMWQFNAGSTELEADGTQILHVPQGAQVTFYITSSDITHGFIIERSNVNFEVVPGHVARATHTFNEPGTYKMMCHEYCGRLHQNMHMTLIVEPAESASVSADEA